MPWVPYVAEWKKLPKFLVQAISNCCCSFSTTISIAEILLDPLKEGNWNLSANRLNCNYTVSCKIYKIQLVQLRNRISKCTNENIMHRVSYSDKWIKLNPNCFITYNITSYTFSNITIQGFVGILTLQQVSHMNKWLFKCPNTKIKCILLFMHKFNPSHSHMNNSSAYLHLYSLIIIFANPKIQDFIRKTKNFIKCIRTLQLTT